MKFKLKFLQIKCHVLEFTKDEAQKMLQKIIKVLRKHSSLTISTLFTLEDVFNMKTSLGSPWVPRTLSQCTLVKQDMVSSNSATVKAT
jgi:hypothetical protein